MYALPVWEYTQLPPAPLALLIKSNLRKRYSLDEQDNT